MNSIFDPKYRKAGFIPVVHAYYDRADMFETTMEFVDHTHSLCEIMYVTEGTMSIDTEDGTQRIGRGQFIWINANVHHWNMRFAQGLCSVMNIEYQYEALDSRMPGLDTLARQSPALDAFLRHPVSVLVLTDRDEIVYRLLKSIVPLADSTHTRSEPLCSMLCTQVLLEVARLRESSRSAGQPIVNRYVSEALDIMRRDYPEKLTAASIASQLHLQPTYLHRLFREHTGLTMNDHLQQIRVDAACELLTSTDDTLLDVAGEVGFCSQQHFSQVFRRLAGMTPQEWRKEHKVSTPQPGAAVT